MSIGIKLLKELTLEASFTKRSLESIPFDKLEFKPTEKSESLDRLAIQIFEIIA